jgi:hypothetical protein
MNENQKMMNSFAKYLAEHPEQRFWQALRNWSGHLNIWVGNEFSPQDTFFFNDEDELKRIEEFLHERTRKIQQSNPVSGD